MQHFKYILIFICFVSGYAQETALLTKSKAVNLALDNNYGIKIATNRTKIAKNNASTLNSGYLPIITANAGANYSNNSTDLTSQNGIESEVKNAEQKTYNASIGLNYTLFDGFGRKYNYQKLKENYNLSELEAKTIIENSLLQLFSMYYQVAEFTENKKIINESLLISKDRLKRAQYAYEYGQNTKLAILNAEVDVNNDSINLINAQRLLANAKRDLNVILGRNVNTNFNVETNVKFELAFDLQTLQTKAKQHNVEVLKATKNIELSNFDIKINKSNYLPSLSFNTSYGANKNDNDATFTYADQLTKGLSAGLSLNWSLFDGGLTKTKVANAKIISENLKIEREQTINLLERDVANALEVYNNSLFILASEEKNVETNQRNFNRTNEQFKLGQVTSIEFRQAQLNLINSRSNLNRAKFDAKIAELNLLVLTGDILNTNF
jgi:outer membrane protein TolC